ncbi:MAG TPA: AgmX/PglI C-terminal domain-containing protein [Gammaproteobacteria bacterium]|nr:AgmX/PglI C-terminal domain-containing protein [Gammaproteobacteria bacterium]
MNTEVAIDQDALHAQLGQARERLAALDRDLRAVDAELAGLAAERARYQLVQDACESLARLDELGAAALFWGERSGSDRIDEHMRQVRTRLAVFQQSVGEVDARRATVVEEIRRVEEGIELVEEELFQAQQQEERRKLEWIVERDIGALPARQAVMPWSRGGEDDRRFRKSLAASLLLSLLIGLLLPFVDLPLPELGEPIEVPERLARLVEMRRLPPPPPVAEQARPDEPEPEPEPELLKEEPPEDAPKVAEAPRPDPVPEPAPQRRAESAGILAFREKFSSLAETRPSSQLGAQARISGAGSEASGPPERSMVTTQAPGSSGGINLASLSRGGGGGGGGPMAGVEVTRATSSIGGGGADRPRAGGGGATAGRTDEEIQIVFDRHKAALYRLYNRELRRDPTLRGQMVLHIRIEPDGRVSLCQLRSTDMAAPDLVAQILERVQTFNFGPKDVPAVTINYPIDFLPAS